MSSPCSQPIQVETHVDGLEYLSARRLVNLPVDSWLHHWISELSPKQSPIDAYEVSLRFTDDSGIQQLNLEYRQQDRPTDVLSFAALDHDMPGIQAIYDHQPTDLGDIIVSVETANRQASAQGHDLRRELAWLTAHGLLHLLGWDHPDETSLLTMLSQQQRLLTSVGFGE